jgi:hypothetical protein
LAAVLLLSLGTALRALPVDHISIVGTAATYTAGVSGSALVTFYDVNSATPTTSEVIYLDVLSNGQVIEGGATPTSFTTSGVLPFASVSITFYTAGNSIELRARPASGATSGTSSVFTVNPSSAAKLVIYGPGQSLLPGHNPSVQPSAVSGTFTAQQPGQDFSVTVQMTDAYFNPVSATDNVSLAADDASLINISAAGPLSAGVKNFTVSLDAPRITRVLTATDGTPPAAQSGSLTVRADGPPAEELFPRPNPFQPKNGPMTLRVDLDTNKQFTVKIVDPFGQPVWERTLDGVAPTNTLTWDGHNDNGQEVAAGFYYAILDVGGSIKSKKKIGVVK